MKSEPTMIPDKYIPYVKRGFAGSGLLFLAMVEEMAERSSQDEAREFAKQVMRRTGALAGQMMAKRMEKNDLAEFAEGYKQGFPNLEILEESEEKFSVRCDFCGAYDVWKGLGLSEEKISELADIYCLRDIAFAEAFNPNIKLEFGARIMKGDSHCEWNHTFNQPAE